MNGTKRVHRHIRPQRHPQPRIPPPALLNREHHHGVASGAQLNSPPSPIPIGREHPSATLGGIPAERWRKVPIENSRWAPRQDHQAHRRKLSGQAGRQTGRFGKLPDRRGCTRHGRQRKVREDRTREILDGWSSGNTRLPRRGYVLPGSSALQGPPAVKLSAEASKRLNFYQHQHPLYSSHFQPGDQQSVVALLSEEDGQGGKSIGMFVSVDEQALHSTDALRCWRRL